MYKAELQVKESKQGQDQGESRPRPDAEHAAATTCDKLDVFDPVGKLQPLPVPREELVKKAVANRPDLLACQDTAFAAPRPISSWPGQRLPRRLRALSALHVSEQHLSWCAQRLLVDPGRDADDPALQPQPGKRHPGEDQHHQTEIQVASAGAW